MIGKSQAFLNSLNLIKKISNSDVPVLIEGETGTGKELAARAIHAASTRKAGSFVSLNCGAIPDEELESELFGRINDADDETDKELSAMDENAQGGTLFLDEVDALTPVTQAALLRYLQNQQCSLANGQVDSTTDIRIIAACNKDLGALAAKSMFRQDLYYRLTQMHLNLPPLRERRGDAAMLAEHFLMSCAVRYGVVKNIDSATKAWLDQYRWPGNIRELENMINREYLISDSPVIHIQSPLALDEERRKQPDRRFANTTELSFSKAKSRAIAEFERSYLEAILTTTQGNVTRAANLVGKERRSLGKLLKKHGIDRHRYIEKTDAVIASGADVSARPVLSSKSVHSSRPDISSQYDTSSRLGISSGTLPMSGWMPKAGLPEAPPSPLLPE